MTRVPLRDGASCEILQLSQPGSQVKAARQLINKALGDPESPGDAACTLPPLFLSALGVRDDVFVKEQNCSASEEPDAADGSCFHWVCFATPPSSSPDTSNQLIRASAFATQAWRMGYQHDGMQPAATMRLVPYVPGYGLSESVQTGKSEAHYEPNYAGSRVWDRKEPFIKIGRLATVERFRGLGLAKVMVDNALAWAGQHPDEFSVESVDGKGWAKIIWQGLVCAHAQVRVVEWYCAKLGFQLDEGMGMWLEEGIEHQGVWKRVKLIEAL